MLTEQDAQNLMLKLIELRYKAKESNKAIDKIALMKHEQLCIDKFKYLVTMRTSKYKNFHNYEDLNQEGLIALVKSMNNYNPTKSNFFFWAHKYIDTKISRCANLHTAIRFPLKVAKKMPPRKETFMPVLIERIRCPDKELEKTQTINIVHTVLKVLSTEQKSVVNLIFGIDGDKPLSINKACKKLNISRSVCLRILRQSLSLMRDNLNYTEE